jgi:S1-C subfamily serine protease
MKGVDLSIFQFNWNTTLSIVFLDADGTIWARFQPREQTSASVEGLIRTMERVLQAHAKGDREPFKAKRGDPLPWPTAETMPDLIARMKGFSAPKNCIHCHHVWAGYIRSLVGEGKTLDATTVYNYPAPPSLGFTMDASDGTKIRSVAPGSAAEKAGLEAGDTIERAAGQPIFSIADLDWVLHRAPESGELVLETARGRKVVPLAQGWRRGGRRGLFGVFGLGMTLQAVEGESLSLRVTKVQDQGSAKEAGFRVGDVIVAVEGKSDPLAVDELQALVWTKYPRGSKLKFAVLRGGERLELVFEVK